MPYVGTLIPFAIEITRASPLRLPVRNLAISRGDDITLALTVFDSAGTALDLTSCVLTATVMHGGAWSVGSGYGWGAHCDYGLGWLTEPHRLLWQAAATPIDPLLGTAQVTIPREVTGCWSGRYELLLSLDGAAGGAVIARGSLDVRGGIVLPRPVPVVGIPPDVLSGIGTYDPPLGAPGIGLFDNVGLCEQSGIGTYDPPQGGVNVIGLLDNLALLPTAILGQGQLGQFRLG